MNSEIKVLFTITDFEKDGLVPDFITDLMRTTPNFTWICGQKMPSKNGLFHEESGWELNFGRCSGIGGSRKVVDFFSSIKSGLKRLQNYQKANEWSDWDKYITIESICHNGHSPDLSFDPDFFQDLGDLGVRLYFQINPMHPIARPKVGVTAMTTFHGYMLVGFRQGSHGANELAFPGGHQEWMRTWEETSQEETIQEVGNAPGSKTGLQVIPQIVNNERYVFVTDNLMQEDKKHYTTVWVKCHPTGKFTFDPNDSLPGLEEGKCEKWHWMTLHQVLTHLFGKQDYSWSDINSQPTPQSHWLPAYKLLKYHKQLDLNWPSHLPFLDQLPIK